MNTVEMVDKHIVKVAEAMGNVAPKAWNVLVAGHFAQGVTELVMCLVYATLIGGCVYLVKRLDGMGMNDETPIRFAANILAALLGIMMVIHTLCSIPQGIMGVIAPEYLAVQEILQAVQ